MRRNASMRKWRAIPENRERQLKLVRRWHSKPENKQRQSERQKKRYRSDAVFAAKILSRANSRYADPETRKRKQEYQRLRSKDPEVRKRRLQRNKERRKLDVQLRLKMNLWARIWKGLRAAGAKKSERTCELLGCSYSELRAHLESQFTEGMNWSNYGRDGWEVDHIAPVSSFDLTDPAQQRECQHYTNLRPLWHADNKRKGGTRIPISSSVR